MYFHGEVTTLLVKKSLYNIKYGFEGSISNIIMVFFSQETNQFLVFGHFSSAKLLNNVQNLR